MSDCNHCDGLSRSRLLHRAIAEAGRGLPAIEHGMPLPAGTGLSRRSFLSHSAGALVDLERRFPDQRGELAGRAPASEVHLKKPLLAVEKSKCPRDVEAAVPPNCRNPERIAFDRDLGGEPGQRRIPVEDRHAPVRNQKRSGLRHRQTERLGAVRRLGDGVARFLQHATDVHSADAVVVSDDDFAEIWFGLHRRKPALRIDPET